MSVGLSLCLSQVTTCRQEFRLDADDSCLRETDLPRSARVLRAARSEPLREALDAFVREHWHDRAILDYVLGLLVPPSRGPMLRFYDEGGPSLRELSPDEDIRKLDGAIADALRGLRLAFDEVERQVGAAARETWELTCGVAGIESDWFRAEAPRGADGDSRADENPDAPLVHRPVESSATASSRRTDGSFSGRP